MNRGAWQATVHRVAKSQIRPSDKAYNTLQFVTGFPLQFVTLSLTKNLWIKLVFLSYPAERWVHQSLHIPHLLWPQTQLFRSEHQHFFSGQKLLIFHWSLFLFFLLFSSVQFSRSVMSNSLRPHEPQHARPPCPFPAPRIHTNPCPLYQWCHPTISSSVIPFSSCPQPFPASGSFLMSQLFASGCQNIGVWASTSVLPMNTQDWSPLGWTGWISLQSKQLSRVFSNATVQKHQFFGA